MSTNTKSTFAKVKDKFRKTVLKKHKKQNKKKEIDQDVNENENNVNEFLNSETSPFSLEIEENSFSPQNLISTETNSSSSSSSTSYPSSNIEIPFLPKENQELVNSKIEDQKELKLIMEVVINPNRKEILNIYEGEKPLELAISFTKKHNLQSSAISKLTELISYELSLLSQSSFSNEEASSSSSLSFKDLNNSNSIDDVKKEFLPYPNYSNFKMQEIRNPSKLEQKLEQKLERSASEQQQQENDFDIHLLQESLIDIANNKEFSTNNELTTFCEKHDTCESHVSYRHYEDSQIKNKPIHKKIHNEKNINSSRKVKQINKHPNKCGTNSTKTTNAVFQRLYENAESKSMFREQLKRERESLEKKKVEKSRVQVTEVSKRLANQQTYENKNYKNIGERLYAEGTAELKWKQELAEKNKIKREEEQDWMCPLCGYQNNYKLNHCENIVGAKVNQITMNSVERNLPNELKHKLCNQPKPQLFQPTSIAKNTTAAKNCKIHEYLYKEGNTPTRKMKYSQQLKAELAEKCPFRPSINENSLKLVIERRQRGHSLDGNEEMDEEEETYQQLYKDAEIRKKRLQELNSDREHSFSPDIGINKLRPKTDRTENEFINRLVYGHQEDRQKILAMLKEKYSEDINPETGQKLFHPQVGRPPISNRNESNLPICEFLFASRYEFENTKHSLRQAYDEQIERERQQGFISNISYQLVEARKHKACANIMRSIISETDKNDDDMIDLTSISISNVDKPLDKIVETALNYFIEEIQVKEVSKEEFYNQLFLVFDSNPIGINTEIISSTRHKQSSTPLIKEQEEYTFHPKIDPNSTEIAMKARNPDMPIHEYLLRQQETVEKKKKRLEAEYRQKEALECPFKPEICQKKFNDIYDKFNSKASKKSLQDLESPPLRTVIQTRPKVVPLPRSSSIF